MSTKQNRLKAEIKRLEKENSFLRSHISTTSNETVGLEKHKGYISYLWANAKKHTLYKTAERLTGYFSKFRLVSLTLKIFGFVTIAVETSAFIFALIVVLALILPPVALFLPIILLCSASRFASDTKALKKRIGGKATIVFFMTRQHHFGDDSFFYRNTLELSKRGYFVIAVSPFILSPKGLTSSKKFFLNVREEADSLFVIRQQYFFYIKKKLLKNFNQRIIYVY